MASILHANVWVPRTIASAWNSSAATFSGPRWPKTGCASGPTDRHPAPAQDGSGSAGHCQADATRRAVPGARSGVTGEAGGGAGPGWTPAAERRWPEVTLIAPMRPEQDDAERFHEVPLGTV